MFRLLVCAVLAVFTFAVPLRQDGLTWQDDDRYSGFACDDPHAPGFAATRRTIKQDATRQDVWGMPHDSRGYLLVELFSRKRLEDGALQTFAKIVQACQIAPSERGFAQNPATQFFERAAIFFSPGFEVAGVDAYRSRRRKYGSCCICHKDLEVIVKVLQVRTDFDAVSRSEPIVLEGQRGVVCGI